MEFEQIVVEKLRILPVDKQQEVLSFIEFLLFNLRQLNLQQAVQHEVSFFDATREFAGCIEDAPSDLSVNPVYLEGLGEV
jgi:hypothetical protein